MMHPLQQWMSMAFEG